MSVDNSTQLEVFVDDAEGVNGVGVLMRDASIVEDEGDLVAGCKLSPWQARCLAHALTECAERLETV